MSRGQPISSLRGRRRELRALRLVRSFGERALLGVTLALLATCGGSSGTGGPRGAQVGQARPAHSAPERVELKFLYTADEHGWVHAFSAGGEVRGGVAELVAHLEQVEGHCARGPCERSNTLLLSGGDSFTGPAISTYFAGLPMAEAMRRGGYFASALGNHEFDFGVDSFDQNRRVSGVRYLSANAELVPGADPRLRTPAFTIAERAGLRIAIVGLTTEAMPAVANPKNFPGLAFGDAEQALSRTLANPAVAGADVRVVVAHECAPKMADILERHPEWELAFLGAGHCHAPFVGRIGRVPLVSPGWRLERYGKARVVVEKGTGGARVVESDATLVPFSRPAGAPAPADPEIAALVARYSVRLDAALGETIGFAREGLGKRSTALATWVTRALRAELGVDVAISNSGGLRQAIPPGPITKKTVYSVLPFDNAVVVLSLTGEALLRQLTHEEAVYDGVLRERGGAFVLASGAPLDPSRLYSVATTDFLYEGGDRFTFKQDDPAGRYTGIDWRMPVIDWTRKQSTSTARPLEALLP